MNVAGVLGRGSDACIRPHNSNIAFELRVSDSRISDAVLLSQKKKAKQKGSVAIILYSRGAELLRSTLDNIPASPSLGVVDALSSAMESVLHSPSDDVKNKTSPTDFNAALAAFVGLAIKRGSLSHILYAVKLLLMGPCPSNVPATSLHVMPYLLELGDAVPEAMEPTASLEGKCGKLMTFGKGDHGKLGHGLCASGAGGDGICTENKLVPTVVAALSDKPIVKIDSLSTHSVAVNSAGDLYTWGNGDKNRLGHGSTQKEHTPRLMGALQQVNVR